MSDSDSVTTRSTVKSTYYDRKKRKPSDNLTAERINKSHTNYFFRRDTNDDRIAYCIICERTNGKAYPYSRRGGSTTNLSGHLQEKHRITRNNYLEYLDESNEVKL